MQDILTTAITYTAEFGLIFTAISAVFHAIKYSERYVRPAPQPIFEIEVVAFDRPHLQAKVDAWNEMVAGDDLDVTIESIDRFESMAATMCAPVAATIVEVDSEPLGCAFDTWTVRQLRKMIFDSHGKRPRTSLRKRQLIAIAEGDLALL